MEVIRLYTITLAFIQQFFCQFYDVKTLLPWYALFDCELESVKQIIKQNGTSQVNFFILHSYSEQFTKFSSCFTFLQQQIILFLAKYMRAQISKNT